MKRHATQLRNQALEPLAEEAHSIRGALRQASNVDLEAIHLDGSSTRRRVRVLAEVDGIAQVLARLAKDCQVIVLPHDGRLPDAVSRTAKGARILAVSRHVDSAVEIASSADPGQPLSGRRVRPDQ